MPANGTPNDRERRAKRSDWVERRLSLEARDPTPFEDTANFWRATAQAATIVMCVLMLGVLLYLARALLLPVLCAVVGRPDPRPAGRRCSSGAACRPG